MTAAVSAPEPVLDVVGLTLELPIDSRWCPIVGDVGFSVGRGETVGIVGESGSGKTLTSLAIVGLAPPEARCTSGQARFDGVDLLALGDRELQRVRGRQIGMIFQEPRRSLNPAFTVGEQVAEIVRRHLGLGRRQAWARAVELLDMVSVPSPERRAHDHPHRYSGGMCQRAMLAMALACEPKLLIADEPTTALDVTVQAQVLDLIGDLQRQLGLAVVFITHDLGIVAEVCDSLVVLYSGQVVERGDVAEVFARPTHPYTAGLLASIPDLRNRTERLGSIPGSVPLSDQPPAGCRFHPRCGHAIDACATSSPPLVTVGGRAARCLRAAELTLVGIDPDRVDVARRRAEADDDEAGTDADAVDPAPTTGNAVLEIRGLVKGFVWRRDLVGRPAEVVHAARGIDLSVAAGRTLALVGESGVGKSTVGRIALGLLAADEGSVEVMGEDVGALRGRRLAHLRRLAVMVFQNPYNSFDPKIPVGDAVAEPLVVHRLGGSRRERRTRVASLLDSVGLTDRHAMSYPYELSGGELQRAAIARALATDPAVIVCDEPVAALDMSIRAEVVNLLRDLQASHGIAYLFISHDLALVRLIAHDVAVMHDGRIVELAPVDRVFAAPQHEYTQQLLAAVPVPDPGRRRGSTAARPGTAGTTARQSTATPR